jgi:hypothetical protein
LKLTCVIWNDEQFGGQQNKDVNFDELNREGEGFEQPSDYWLYEGFDQWS